MAVAAMVGPELLGAEADRMDLALRNTPPGSLDDGWLTILGTDSLGRSILARIIVATRTTVGIAVCAAAAAMVVGGLIGLVAGYVGRWPGKLIMQFSDVVQSFPSMLLAMIVLYVFAPSALNLIFVLGFTRLPEYIRVVRAEVLELRERLFVDAARVMGSSSAEIMRRHLIPVVLPTVANILMIDIAFVMLSESGLSFLGIGIQPPDVTWGLMVANGRNYLSSAWWLAFFPGLMIMMFTLAINILYRWIRRIGDPSQRWRYELPG